VIRGLYQVYTDAKFNVRSELLPPEYRSTDVPLARNVLDFLSGMMDSFALQQYEQFFGAGRLSGLYHPPA
jgi:dGTP triphosphohydrolase